MKRALALVVILASATFAHAQTVVLFTTTGMGTWTVPAGVTSVKVECVGGGGTGGGINVVRSGGCGGCGGSYAKSTISVKPGDTLYYWVGRGGGNPNARGGYQDGEPSWVSAVKGRWPANPKEGAYAAGGLPGGIGNYLKRDSIGTVTLRGGVGGVGASGTVDGSYGGGGGGGGFNPAAAIQAASDGQNGAVGGVGGAGGPFGGNGASALPVPGATTIGGNGTFGGGGGGPAVRAAPDGRIYGGAGGNGWIRITY